MSYTNQLGTIYLTRPARSPPAAIRLRALTPFVIPRGLDTGGSGAPILHLRAADRSRPPRASADSAYPLTVQETIPIGVEGTSYNNAQRLWA